LIKKGNSTTVEEIGKDPDFISEETLTIKYRITPDVLVKSDYTWEIEKAQTASIIKTGDSSNPEIDHANKQFSFKPQHDEGSSPSGSSNRTKGLKYNLKFKYNSTYPFTFTIEQDDINRARQESKIIFSKVPARDKYKEVNTRLFKGTTVSCFPDRKMWLDQDIGTIDTNIYNSYSNVWYSCSWRSPYFNKHLGSNSFAHPSGKAVDCRPDGQNQTAQDYKNQWDTIKGMGTTVLLELGGRILRSKNTGWKKLTPTDSYYDSNHPNRTWEYKEPGATIELGYRNASHYHIANYP